MKKQKVFDLASMPKMVLIITLVVMLGTLFGAVSYLLKAPKTDLPIVNPIIETQCGIDADCELVYVGSDIYPPCNTSSEEYQCLNESEKIKMRDRDKSGPIVKCSPYAFDRYTCKCANGKCEKVKEELVEEVIVTTDKMEYEQGEMVKITVENNSDREQRMGYPIYVVERFENNSWLSVRQVWCPCGTTCSIINLSIKPKDNLEIEWNQRESWCDDPNLTTNTIILLHSEEISNQVQSGRYRIKSIKVDLNNAKETIYSNEFTIKEKLALDARCEEKVKIFGNCPAYFEEGGYYEFNSETGKCIEKFVSGSGCNVINPFYTLEECQEVCEKQVSISDWQTYRNEEFGFEMKYPLYVSHIEGSGNVSLNENRGIQLSFSEFGFNSINNTYNCRLFIKHKNSINAISIMNRLEKYDWENHFLPKEIDGLNGKIIQKDGYGTMNYYFVNTYFIGGDYLYNFQISGEKYNKETVSDFEKIISTFKLI